MYGCNKLLLIFLIVFLALEVVAELLLCVLISANLTALRFLIQQGKHAPAIARILLRDSLLYFGSMLALILINLIVWSTENDVGCW
ncbi:hypothetical protein EIP86_011113 [Pleurotus ostreatoroseus]|nr:hypothetical protein EIP86_011113 [Pleurotus ostreatoroseus]